MDPSEQSKLEATQNQNQQQQTEPQLTPEQAQLEQWCAKGLGGYRYIETKEQLDKLPDIGKQEIRERFPEHYEMLAADESKLPAEVRLRLARKELLFEDMDHLQAAGFAGAVKFLEQRKQQFMQQQLEAWIEQQQQQMAAANAAASAAAEEAQQRLQQQARAQARVEAVRYLHRVRVQELTV